MPDTIRPITTVVFNFDGLMFDTESLYYELLCDFARKRGKVITPSIMHDLMGRKGIDGIRGLLENMEIDDDPNAVQVELRNRYGEALYTRARKMMMPGFLPLLKRVKDKGLRVAVATSSYSGWVNILFSEHNLHDAFDCVITGNDVKQGKPHPEIYLTLLERLKVHPQECVVLEDNMHGVFAAKAAGCRVVAVPKRFAHDLDFSIADLVVQRLDHPELGAYIMGRE
jgi:HAD superfamily hydrolase (TIGR01509 family)